MIICTTKSFSTACRRFSPVLRALHDNLKTREGTEDFEIIFCSMDRTHSEYESYTKNMPWWCLPPNSPATDRLVAQYRALAVPQLVVVDRDGSVLSTDAVQDVARDPEGYCFPWRPKSIADILPPHYIASDESLRPTTELDNKHLLLYFGASWCGRKFHLCPFLYAFCREKSCLILHFSMQGLSP